MANIISVLKSHEHHLMAALAAIGIGTGGVLTYANYDKIKKALEDKGVPHDTHDNTKDVGPGRVYVGK